MRLINTTTLKLEEFPNGKPVPPYAILSHVWRDGEVTFQDMQNEAIASAKIGHAKTRESCRLAREDSLSYVWIDTCCIDKSSSTELSESLNSMFKWYGHSTICYAYLADVSESGLHSREKFTWSWWFTRGFTLQELLAPTRLDFYDKNWIKFASKTDTNASAEISAATGIDQAYLNPSSFEHLREMLSNASIAERMCWASRRRTTAEEDVAYCLLGIFAVNIPPLYGEGQRAAFRRLQEEIIKHSDDQSVFAWNHSGGLPGTLGGFLAASPSDFAGCANLVPCPIGFRRSVFSITNKGVHITLPISGDYALLECYSREDDRNKLKAVALRNLHDDTYSRVVDAGISDVDYQAWNKWKRRTINVVTHPEQHHTAKSRDVKIVIRSIPDGYKVEPKRITLSSTTLVNGRPKSFDCTLEREGLKPIILRVCLRAVGTGGHHTIDYGLQYKDTADDSEQAQYLGTPFLTTVDGSVLHYTQRRRIIFGERQVHINILCVRGGFMLALYQAIYLASFWIPTFPRSIYYTLMVFVVSSVPFQLTLYELLTRIPFSTNICLPLVGWAVYRLMSILMTPRPKRNTAIGFKWDPKYIEEFVNLFTIGLFLNRTGQIMDGIRSCAQPQTLFDYPLRALMNSLENYTGVHINAVSRTPFPLFHFFYVVSLSLAASFPAAAYCFQYVALEDNTFQAGQSFTFDVPSHKS